MSLTLNGQAACPENRPAIEFKQPNTSTGKFRYLYGGGVLPERVVRRRCGWEEGRRKRAELAQFLTETEGVFSDGYVAAAVGAHPVTVGRVRHLLERQGILRRVTVRNCRDGEARDMSKRIAKNGSNG